MSVRDVMLTRIAMKVAPEGSKRAVTLCLFAAGVALVVIGKRMVLPK